MPQIQSLPGFQEPFCAISHLGGALVFALLSYPLLRRSRGAGGNPFLVGVFAASCVTLLALSGVFHMLPTGSPARSVLGRLDHAAIFLVIAGTHTPIQGFFFRGIARWGVIALMWTLTVTGITLFSVFYHTLPPGLGTAVYFLLGWIAGLSAIVVWRRHGTDRILLMILGGAVYTVGAILLGLNWPTLIPGVIGPHEIWHVAVLVAIGMHWHFMQKNAHWQLEAPAA